MTHSVDWSRWEWCIDGRPFLELAEGISAKAADVAIAEFVRTVSISAVPAFDLDGPERTTDAIFLSVFAFDGGVDVKRNLRDCLTDEADDDPARARFLARALRIIASDLDQIDQ